MRSQSKIASKKSCFQPILNCDTLWIPSDFLHVVQLKPIKICPTTTNLEAQMEFEKFDRILSNKSFQVKLFFFCIQMISIFLFVLSNGMDLAQQSKPSRSHIKQCLSTGIKEIITSKAFILDHQDLKFHHIPVWCGCFDNRFHVISTFAVTHSLKWIALNGSDHCIWNNLSVQSWRSNVWLNHKPMLMTERKIAITQNNVDWNLSNRWPQRMGAGMRFV